MNWSDYEAIWRRQPLPIGAAADVAVLQASFDGQNRKMAATLRVSDFAEALAGVAGMIAFAVIWWRMGWSGWPVGGALVLVARVTSVFIGERRRVRRTRPTADAPMVERVEADIVELRRRRELVQRIWWWYLGPVAAAVGLVVAAFVLRAQAWQREGLILFLGAFTPLWLSALGIAWWVNRQALRQRIEPRLAELEKLRSALLSP